MRRRRVWAPVVFLVGELEIMGSRGSRGGITGWERRTGGRGKERGIPFERKFGLCTGDNKFGLALERVLERWCCEEKEREEEVFEDR